MQCSAMFVTTLMQVSLEQDSKISNIMDSLAMNITMLRNLVSQPQAGTVNLSGTINVFESCATLIEGNCTIHPATPGNYPAPCLTTPEVLLNQVYLAY